MADYEETGHAEEPLGIMGGQKLASKESLNHRASLRDRLLAQRNSHLTQIDRINKTLDLLERIPEVEQLLNLLPKVGLY